ncbi:RidA family protein [Microbacterium sp. dk485]|uniref:RidA family protein n=1 Tax=Microbacterium sp. dk485 TaxID=2560021 RepID=UPI0014313868|nr:RidA family protein [Microbacterium sp. dk485]
MIADVARLAGADGSPFSSATIAGGWVFPAGQVGERADGSVPESFEEEVALALTNLRGVLEAAGSDLAHVVRIQVILTDMADFYVMNRIYRDHIGQNLPTRFTHGAALAPGYRVELVATAVVA